jgi:hypothetical protein
MTIVIDGTTGISGVDGTASNPSYEGTDSNTGIFYPAADTVAIGTGGTEALRVNSSQNVGIGTQSPFLRLDVGGSSTALLSNQTSTYAPSVNSTATSFKLFNESQTNGAYSSLEFWTRNASNNINIAYIASPSTSSNDVGTLVFGRRTGNLTSAESMRLDSSGRLLIGDTVSRSNLAVGQSQVQIASASFSTFAMFGNANNTDGSYIALSKARGGTLGGTTAVQSGDILGGIFFEGYNGTGFATAAQIYTKVDGTVSGSQMPGRLEFYTTPTGSNTAVERARIDSSGNFIQTGVTTASGVSMSALGSSSANSTVNSATYNVTILGSAKVFWVYTANGDGCLVVTNYTTSTITIVGTGGVIVASASPASNQLGISKSINSHVVTFKTGSAAASTWAAWGVGSLSSTVS